MLLEQMGPYGRERMAAYVILHGAAHRGGVPPARGVGKLLQGVVQGAPAQAQRVPARGVGRESGVCPRLGKYGGRASAGEHQQQFDRRVGAQLIAEPAALGPQGVDAAVGRVGYHHHDAPAVETRHFAVEAVVALPAAATAQQGRQRGEKVEECA